MDTLGGRDGQVLLVCEVSRQKKKKARATETKVRNWSKKPGTAGRREGGTGNKEEIRDPEHSKPDASLSRTVVWPSLPGGPRTPLVPSEPLPMPTSVLRRSLPCSYSPILSPRRCTLPRQAQAVRAGRKHVFLDRRAAALRLGQSEPHR